MKQHKANDECLRDLLRGNVPGMADDFFEGRLRHKLDRVDACRPARGWARWLPGGLAAAVLLVCHRQAWEGGLTLSRWVVEAADRLGSLGWTCAGCWRAGWPWCVACWPILWRSGGCEVQPATGMTQKAVERPFGRSTAFCVVCDFTAGLVEIRAGVYDFRIVADVLVDGVGQRVHVAVVQLGDFRCGIEGTRAVRCLGWQHHVHARVAFDGLR